MDVVLLPPQPYSFKQDGGPRAAVLFLPVRVFECVG
jgi:hypothetical protein